MGSKPSRISVSDHIVPVDLHWFSTLVFECLISNLLDDFYELRAAIFGKHDEMMKR